MTDRDLQSGESASGPQASPTRRAFIERLALTTAAPIVLPLLLAHPRSGALAY
jgi:hypothetical protein